MTTKVVKGSVWTLIGQVIPLATSLMTTPFVIRLLGAKGYGVLILVALIPTYFAFTDFGMGTASTRLAAEAFAQGNRQKEANTVRTAALIAFLTSVPIAVALIVFALPIMQFFKVPGDLLWEASFALRLTAVTFVINFLSNVLNTPQLTRLRMDVNTLINAGFRTIGIVLTPFVLYFGGGIAGVAALLLLISLLVLSGHLFFSTKLLREMGNLSIERSLALPLIRFGGPLVLGGIAATILVNLEKMVLTGVSSVETLAYYSVAFTFATIATLFSGAMVQTLIPAFSQLLSPETRERLTALFIQTLRLDVVLLIPGIALMFVAARPIFTVWAGEDFGHQSTLPFYLLLVGIFFNIIAHVPYSVLVASGRSDILAKLYWAEIIPYTLLVAILVSRFGARGAAAAWSVRVLADAVLIVYVSRRAVGVSFDIFHGKWQWLLVAVSPVAVPVLLTLAGASDVLVLALSPFTTAFYCILIWKLILVENEKNWLGSKINAVIGR
jgi:O-antigen/teichoic acid export membrane protein